MGFSSEQLKMKFLIVCLFAAAYAAPEAEADPALLYGGYGYPYAYGGYGHAYGGYGLTYGLPAAHTVVKAADAEEPAVAAVKTVATPIAYASAAYPYAAYPYATYANHVGYPYAHRAAAYGAYVAPVATHTVAKRSADAAPDAEADAYYYGAYGRGYGYGNRYGHSAYYGGYGGHRAYGYGGHYGYGYGWGR